jgi:GNAT superfamily N-acetyltransferase
MAIRLLAESDDPSQFSCGTASLDQYLAQHAWANVRTGVSVTHVFACGRDIQGFITLAGTTVRAAEIGAAGLPRYPLPALLVARLAVDSCTQGRGIGSRLLRFALEEAVAVHVRTGCVGVAVDANEGAVSFYEGLGFEPMQLVSRADTLRMFLDMGAVFDAIG